MNACLTQSLNSVLNVKAVVEAFNQEKALVGAFSSTSRIRAAAAGCVEPGQESCEQLIVRIQRLGSIILVVILASQFNLSLSCCLYEAFIIDSVACMERLQH